MSQRTLSSSECRSLRDDQKAYLMKHQFIVTLEPHVPASLTRTAQMAALGNSSVLTTHPSFLERRS